MASTLFTFKILEPVGVLDYGDILFLGEDADGAPATFPVGCPEALRIIEALLAGCTVEALVVKRNVIFYTFPERLTTVG